MKLESLKLLTGKKFGFAVFVILVMFVATLSFPYEVSTGGYILLSRIQGITSNNSSKRLALFNVTTSFQKTAILSRKYDTTLTTKANHQKDTVTTKATKAETKMPATKTTTKTTTPKMTTPKKTTPKTKSKTTVKISTTTTKAPKKTTMKIPKITTKRPMTRTMIKPKTTSPPKHFVCLNFMGRLGNLMFEYASAYGMARTKGMGVIISKNDRISKIFHIERGSKTVDDTSMCRGVKTKYEVRASAFDKETMNFNNDKNIALTGYLQSYKYFEKVSDELRRQFSFQDSIRIKADKVVRGILQKHLVKHGNESKTWTFVGIHVRRGDMVNHPHGYTVAPKEYFQRTQNMFRALYKTIFIVCSDDIKWCKNNMKSEDTYFVEGNSPEVDMATLSSCNHTISSVGSFSWWAAWLTNGLVTYYCPPARPGSGLRTQYSKDFNDYFPSKWIRIKL